MSGKASVGAPGADAAQEEILRKLEDTAAQRQIDIGGGVMVNMGQEDYGMNDSIEFNVLQKKLVVIVDGWNLYIYWLPSSTTTVWN